MTQAIVTRFVIDTVNRLIRLAEMTGRPKSYYIKEAVNEKLDELELAYLAQSRAEDVRAGRSITVSWEDVKKQNGL